MLANLFIDMEKADIKYINKKRKPSPILKGLPEKLKDTKCYVEIEKKLRDCLISDHKHDSVKAFVKCKRCKTKLDKRQKLMESFGFKSTEQYLEWKKIMSIIISQSNFQVR